MPSILPESIVPAAGLPGSVLPEASTPVASPGPEHTFHAVAFVENFSLKELHALYPSAKRSARVLLAAAPAMGQIFFYPFGVIVFMNVSPGLRETEIQKLRAALPKLRLAGTILEDLVASEDQSRKPTMDGGKLSLDRLTPQRAALIANTVGQSAAMEYYEKIVDEMFTETDRLVERLERDGSVPFGTRVLHQFIGAAIGTRNEVLSVLHLLDKPDEVWDDPDIDRIYGELRAEFDLTDRFQALELKLRSVQEALELVLDVARDRRLVLLEVAIVLLIIMELVLALVRR